MKKKITKRTALILACALCLVTVLGGCIGGEKEEKSDMKEALAKAADQAQEEAEAAEEEKEAKKAAEKEAAKKEAAKEAEEEAQEEEEDEEPEITRELLVEALGEGFDEGQVIQDFEFKDEDGNICHVSDFAGKAVYINFFTTWCVYCGYEMEDLQRVAEAYSDDAELLLIDVMETPKEVEAYKKEYGITQDVYYVDDWQAGDFVLEGVPVSIVIDRNGIIYAKNIGMAEGAWMEGVMESAVDPVY